MRLGVPEMPNMLVSQHRLGFYFRVITEGLVRAGDDIVLTRRGRHELSVADVDALLYLPDRDMHLLRKIVDVPALSPGWQQSFRDMLVVHEKPTASTQLPIGVEPGWSGLRRLRVTATHRESPTVLSIRLGATGPSFSNRCATQLGIGTFDCVGQSRHVGQGCRVDAQSDPDVPRARDGGDP
jgi:hypothetical protein